METKATAKFHPEWNPRSTRVDGPRDGDGARRLRDHPSRSCSTIATVEQANQAFDAITYQKGEAVIRMLEAYVGEDAWRDGRAQLHRSAHAYGNTVSRRPVARDRGGRRGRPITAIAHDFTLQPGVPLIRVASAALRRRPDQR